MKKLFALIFALLLLCSCGAEEEIPKIDETQKNTEASGTASETEEEKYYRMAKEKQIPENFAKEVFSEDLFAEYITNPEGFFEFSKESTEDGRYNLWNCYYAATEDALGQAIYYSENTKTGEISILPEIHNDWSYAGILDNENVFVFYPYIGGACEESSVRFYKFSDTSEPYAVWEPLEGEFEHDYISFYALCKIYGKNMLCAFWAKVPGGANEMDPPEPEGCTYTLSVIDENGKTAAEYDTGIAVTEGRYGGFEHGKISSVSEDEIQIEIIEGGKKIIYIFDLLTGKTESLQ